MKKLFLLAALVMSGNAMAKGKNSKNICCLNRLTDTTAVYSNSEGCPKGSKQVKSNQCN
jgi:hypothetical protein